jgi:hypothetical protein
MCKNRNTGRGGVLWPCLGVLVGGSLIMNGGVAIASDQVGVYFDIAGTINTTTAVDPTQYQQAWVIIKDLSTPMCIVQVIGRIEGPIADYCWRSLIGSYDYDCLLPWGTERCGYMPAIEPQASVPIVEMWFRVISSDPPVRFFVDLSSPEWGPSGYGPPGWESTGAFVQLTPSSGSPEVPVAMINGPVPVESSSWGSVKAMYR